MTREEAVRIFRKEIECMSHSKCSDCILEKVCDPISTTPLDSEYIAAFSMAIEALSAEPLTDTEQRIFLSAMGREEKVCKEVDAGHPRENYEDTLLAVCRSITRKVKGALWK